MVIHLLWQNILLCRHRMSVGFYHNCHNVLLIKDIFGAMKKRFRANSSQWAWERKFVAKRVVSFPPNSTKTLAFDSGMESFLKDILEIYSPKLQVEPLISTRNFKYFVYTNAAFLYSLINLRKCSLLLLFNDANKMQILVWRDELIDATNEKWPAQMTAEVPFD